MDYIRWYTKLELFLLVFFLCVHLMSLGQRKKMAKCVTEKDILAQFHHGCPSANLHCWIECLPQEPSRGFLLKLVKKAGGDYFKVVVIRNYCKYYQPKEDDIPRLLECIHTKHCKEDANIVLRKNATHS